MFLTLKSLFFIFLFFANEVEWLSGLRAECDAGDYWSETKYIIDFFSRIYILFYRESWRLYCDLILKLHSEKRTVQCIIHHLTWKNNRWYCYYIRWMERYYIIKSISTRNLSDIVYLYINVWEEANVWNFGKVTFRTFGNYAIYFHATKYIN